MIGPLIFEAVMSLAQLGLEIATGKNTETEAEQLARISAILIAAQKSLADLDTEQANRQAMIDSAVPPSTDG